MRDEVPQPMVEMAFTYSEAEFVRQLLSRASLDVTKPGPLRVTALNLRDAMDAAMRRTRRFWTHPVTIFFMRLFGWKPGARNVMTEGEE